MYYNNRKLLLNIFWILLGAVLVILSAKGVLDSSVYSGMGGALIGIGMLQLLRNIRYRTDSGYREQIDIEAGDERNSYIRMKSWAWTGYIVVLAEGIGVVIATVLGEHELQKILAYSVCLIMGVYWITYMILKRKY